MKHLIFTIFLFYCLQNHALSQDVMVHKEMIEMKDSVKVSCTNCYSNLVSVGGKYYFNPLKNTITTLANNGFSLDQEAFEYQLKLYNLPKIFYYQQLGTLRNTNYASVTGMGIKEDIRFNLIKNSNFVLTPYIELGGGYYRMNIAKGVTTNSVSTVLGSQIENYFLDNFILSGDVGLDLGFGFNVDDKRFSLILNGGFIANYPSEWRLASSLAFKEKVNLASPYAGLTLRMDICCADGCGSGMCK
ncbi:MAG: hypothetical protein IPN89_01575 [Saprospiraceae bacterium]|nr:hypothetical protein [Saprospiraceae bacterium]